MSNKLTNDPSNLISASQHFHNCFDGMMTVDPITQQPNIPLIAIKPLEGVAREEFIGEPKMKRQRVEVEMHFRSEVVAETIRFKAGTSKISNVVWRSFIHVENARTCQDCLNWKYKKSVKAWKEADETNEQMLSRE